jgi:PhnB protein
MSAKECPFGQPNATLIVAERFMSEQQVNTPRYVIPMLVCRDAGREIDFCRAAFGAVQLSRRTGPEGSVVHATLQIGEAVIMVHGEFPNLASRAPQPDGTSPVVIYIYVDDVDAVVGRAVNAGARVLIPVTNQPWGDRVGRIIDPAGHVWNVASRIKDSNSTVTDFPNVGSLGLL